MSNSSHSVLVVCFDNIGDLVFISPLTRELSQRESIHSITLWCKNYTADLASLLPGVDRVIASEPFWDKSPRQRRGSFIKFAKTWLAVRNCKFDVAYIAGRNSLTCRLVYLLGIKQRVGFDYRNSKKYLTDVVADTRKDRPVLEGIQRLLLSSSSQNPSFYSIKKPQISFGVENNTIGLHPFAGSKKRCAPLNAWLRLAEALTDEGYKILFFGGDDELSELCSIRRTKSWKTIASYKKNMNLYEVASVLSELHCFIGHDSGLLHVASALKTPVVGLYLPGQPERTFPQGSGESYVIHRVSPDELDEEELVAAVTDFLKSLR